MIKITALLLSVSCLCFAKRGDQYSSAVTDQNNTDSKVEIAGSGNSDSQQMSHTANPGDIVREDKNKSTATNLKATKTIAKYIKKKHAIKKSKTINPIEMDKKHLEEDKKKLVSDEKKAIKLFMLRIDKYKKAINLNNQKNDLYKKQINHYEALIEKYKKSIENNG